MKKLTTIFVLLVFLLSSISVAFVNGDESNLTKKNSKADFSKTMMGKKIENKAKVEGMMGARAAAKGMTKEELQGQAEKRKEDLDESRKTLRTNACVAQKTLEGNCGQAFDKIKEHLHQVLDRINDVLTKLSDRVSKSSLQNKEALLKDIQDKLSEVKALGAKVDAAKTKDELKAVMKIVRETFVDYKKFFEDLRQQLQKERYSLLLDKAQKIEDKLKKLLDTIKAKGGSDDKIKAVEQAIAAVDAQIKVVKQAIEQGDNALIKNSLHKLQELLKDVVKQFRKAGKGDVVSSVVAVKPVSPEGTPALTTEDKAKGDEQQ